MAYLWSIFQPSLCLGASHRASLAASRHVADGEVVTVPNLGHSPALEIPWAILLWCPLNRQMKHRETHIYI